MSRRLQRSVAALVLVGFSFGLSGCAAAALRRTRKNERRISELEQRVARLEGAAEVASPKAEKEN